VSGLSDFHVSETGAGGGQTDCPGCGAPLWGRAFGDTAVSHGRTIAVDDDGSLLVAGIVSADFSFGGAELAHMESWDAVVGKLDGDGGHLWSVALVGRSDQLVDAVASGPERDAVVAGAFATEIFIDGVRHPETVDALDADAYVACLDAQDGHRKWSKTFGGATTQRATALAVNDAGEIFVMGDFFDGIDIGGAWVPSATPGLGTSDVFLIRLGSDGAYQSHLVFGDAAHDNARAIAIDGATRFMAIEFEGALNVGLGPLTAVGRDAVVFQMVDEPMNAVTWQVHITGAGAQQVSGVASDGRGGVLVAGTFAGALEIGTLRVVSYREAAYLAAIDAQGTVSWLRHFVGARAGNGTPPLAFTGTGLLTGTFFSWMAVDDQLIVSERTLAEEPSRDLFLLKFDDQGKVLWSRGFGSSGDDVGAAVALDAAGEGILVGDLDGSATLGNQPIETSADVALLVAKFAP